ncbi:hypothetical protein Sked_29080 [Sanguibacter keddieii DSM 10542]|uniref:Uncharacterized protein n=1 Tax=Sanguibacter keddieii (strain ATCC 51767 / DSM 10542 / NCFB 3025 / ST-74) TaxID=446469 RepID=D1BBN9_SANKS|nr:hypothetical protein [Sanguibacter keddieii]ACZ22810.1 hypothetical protein Sked_29080 [Sanguibacter keddieii DSM 10542]
MPEVPETDPEPSPAQIFVTRRQVEAARVAVKAYAKLGYPSDPVLERIANARPAARSTTHHRPPSTP